MELSQNDSKMLQALSVTAMVWLHLFDKPYEGLFFPLFFFRGTPLSFYMAQLSDFCVFGFAFLSGYAHMILHEQPEYYKRSLKRLFSLFCSYWLIILFFSFVSVITGHSDFMPGSITKFLLNALALDNSYNGAWWYMLTYAVLVLLLRPLKFDICSASTSMVFPAQDCRLC